MFGKAKRERAELKAEIVTLCTRLDAMQRELIAVKKDVCAVLEGYRSMKDEVQGVKRDVLTVTKRQAAAAEGTGNKPDEMSEGEMLNKWYMGEKGDGF